jgi:hypothetical protein
MPNQRGFLYGSIAAVLRPHHQSQHCSNARADDPTRSPSASRPGHRVRRRAFLYGSAAIIAAPRAADAQQAGKVYRIGYLGFTPPHLGGTAHVPLVQGLRELGWVEGKNIEIEGRYSEAKYERLPHLAAELVQLRVDVLVQDAWVGDPTSLLARADQVIE